MLYFHVATNRLYGSSYFWRQVSETTKDWWSRVRVHDKKDKKVYKPFQAQKQEYNHEQVASQI